MTSKASPTLIGVFVLGGIALAVLALVMFSRYLFFAKTQEAIFNFENGVTGLQIGAPVEFRGVKVGEVTSIRAVYDPEKQIFYFPVEARFVQEAIEVLGRKGPQLESTREALRKRIVEEAGLRARLEQISFVTGLQRVQLEFAPDTPVRFYGGPPSAFEVPTIPSKTEQLEETLRELPIRQIVVDLRDALANINNLLGPPSEKGKDSRNVRDVMKTLEKLMADLDKEVPATASSIRKTSDSARDTIGAGKATLLEISNTAATLERRINSLAESLEATSANAGNAAAEARTSFSNLSRMTDGDAPLNVELVEALKEVGAAARSLRLLASELERRPDALIRGRPIEEKTK